MPAWAGAAAALAAGCCFADTVFVAAGRGADSTITGLGVQFDRRDPLVRSAAWRTTAQMEIMAATLVGEQTGLRGQAIGALAVTPNLRWTRVDVPLSPYPEAGLGARTLSRTTTPYSTRFSTNFQFGEFAGIGFHPTRGGRLEISVRVEHISNGGIREPNAGVTFLGAHLAWAYRQD